MSRRSRRVTVAHAHSEDHAYVYLVVNGEVLIGSVQLPLRDLEAVTGQRLRDPVDKTDVEGPTLKAVQDYLTEHFSIRIEGQEPELSFHKAKVRLLSSGPYLYVDYETPGFALRRPSHLEITYDAIFESIDGREALLIALVSRGWFGLYRHKESTLELNKDQVVRLLTVDKPTPVENLSATFEKGGRLVRAKSKGLLGRLASATRGR